MIGLFLTEGLADVSALPGKSYRLTPDFIGYLTCETILLADDVFLAKWHSGYRIAVNSESERQRYAKKYRIPLRKIAVLPDSYERNNLPVMEELAQIQVEPRCVFCVGCMRDFKTLLLVARKLPEYTFNVIACRKNWMKEWKIPANMKVYFDTLLDFFYTCLSRSAILYLPLNRDEANGLIVLTKAALLHKPIIVTDTSCTRNYIVNNQNGILLPMGGGSGICY